MSRRSSHLPCAEQLTGSRAREKGDPELQAVLEQTYRVCRQVGEAPTSLPPRRSYGLPVTTRFCSGIEKMNAVTALAVMRESEP